MVQVNAKCIIHTCDCTWEGTHTFYAFLPSKSVKWSNLSPLCHNSFYWHLTLASVIAESSPLLAHLAFYAKMTSFLLMTRLCQGLEQQWHGGNRLQTLSHWWVIAKEKISECTPVHWSVHIHTSRVLPLSYFVWHVQALCPFTDLRCNNENNYDRTIFILLKKMKSEPVMCKMCCSWNYKDIVDLFGRLGLFWCWSRIVARYERPSLEWMTLLCMWSYLLFHLPELANCCSLKCACIIIILIIIQQRNLMVPDILTEVQLTWPSRSLNNLCENFAYRI